MEQVAKATCIFVQKALKWPKSLLAHVAIATCASAKRPLQARVRWHDASQVAWSLLPGPISQGQLERHLQGTSADEFFFRLPPVFRRSMFLVLLLQMLKKVRNKLSKRQHEDEASWSTRSWLSLQAQRMSVALQLAAAEEIATELRLLGALGVQSVTSHPGPRSSEAHPAGRMIGVGLRAREP